MRIKQRKALFTNIVPFPVSKTAGELTILGDELNAFELTPGKARVQLIAENLANIADTLSMELKVSYDKGKTWVKVASFDELKNGSGALSVLKEGTISFAPRIRLDAVFNASGALLADHGCKIHAELKEGELNRHIMLHDALEMPASVSTEDIPAVAATIDVVVPVGINDGDSVVISDGGTTETYDIYDNVGSDYVGGNILVDIQAADPDIPALIASAINTNSSLVGATEVEGTITVTASTAGIAGNDITVTVNEGVEDPVVYNLENGADVIDVPESVYEGVVFNPEVKNIQKVLVITTCDSTKTKKVVSYDVQSSFDGENWWTVNTASIDLGADLVEAELTTKLGTQFKVVATVAEEKELIADHNTKFHLVVFYA